MAYVRLCRFCGHISAATNATWCDNCRSFSGLTTVPRAEGERLSRRQQLRSLRRRLIRIALVVAPVVGLLVWALWSFLELGPDPPQATTDISVNVAPQTWAQVRRTPQNTGFTPDQAPFPQSVKWTYFTPKPIVSSASVADGQVFIATEDGRTVALDRETGQVEWEYRSGSPASSAPAVAGDLVFFTVRPGAILALEQKTGELRWEREIDDPILASPIVVGGTLYVGAGNRKLYALDAVNGEELWTFTTNDWITAQAAFDSGMVIITSKRSLVHVINARTGKERLVYDTGRGRSALGGAAVQDDLVYFGTLAGRVWAINLQSETRPWDRAILFWKTNFYVWGLAGSPPVQRGSVWASRLEGDITEALALAHDSVYATTTQGKVAALDQITGAERWSKQLDSKITSAPTVAGDTLLIGAEDGLVLGLDAHSGEELWEFQTGGKITGSPIVAGNTLYITSHDGTVYAVTGPTARP